MYMPAGEISCILALKTQKFREHSTLSAVSRRHEPHVRPGPPWDASYRRENLGGKVGVPVDLD
jgi:hypothetical protein